MPLVIVPLHYVIWLTLRLLGHQAVLLAYAPLAGFIAMPRAARQASF